MKAETQTVFGVYTTDGYTTGRCLAYYPLKAAAHGSPEAKGQHGYVSIYPVEIVKFDEDIYVVKTTISKDQIVGKVPTFQPTSCYQDYAYTNGYDKTKYYIGDEELLNLLGDGTSHSISKKWVITDGTSYFALKQKEPITLNKFVMSRELATAHALGKLTDEEKGLLGLK